LEVRRSGCLGVVAAVVAAAVCFGIAIC